MQYFCIQDYADSFLDFFFYKTLSLALQRKVWAMENKYYTKNCYKRLFV